MVSEVCTKLARTWKSDTIGSEKLYWQHYANINKTTLVYSRYFYIQWCTAWLKWDTILRSFGKYQGQLFNAITRVISFNSRPRILWSFFQTQILIWLNYRKIKGKCFTSTKINLAVKKSVSGNQDLQESDLITTVDFLYIEM